MVRALLTINTAVEMMAEFGMCPADQIATYRARLTALGLQGSAGAGAGSSGAPQGPVFPVGQQAPGGPTHGAGQFAFASPDHFANEARRRLWAPQDQSPSVLPLSVTLGRSDTVVVILVEAHLYVSGVHLVVWTHGRGDHLPFFPTRPDLAERLGRTVATEPDVQVSFDDGRSAGAVNLIDASSALAGPAEHVVLVSDGGSGTDQLLRRGYWLTPRPTDRFTLAFSWPEHGLGRTEHRIDLPHATPPSEVWV